MLQPIVAIQQFIEAVRDSGYKSTSFAIAELVDNALEASADLVDVNVTTGSERSSQRITVVDDGTGMDPEAMQLALQFGGSTRFNSRRGMGRYGMGLPCSCLSLARRIDLYSWQKPSAVWWTFMDLNAIASGTIVSVPEPARSSASLEPTACNTPSGTVVVISECDRLEFRRIRTVASKLCHDLGRIFRRAIGNGKTLRVNGRSVETIDPLFLDRSAAAPGARPFGPPIEFPIRAPGGDSQQSTVKVLFSELPVNEWHDRSNEFKSASGVSKGAGVSILRAGREIDYGWYFMGGKRRENYDDWWRCQVDFDPVLDEMFGVTHTKQKINPTEALDAILTPQLEAVARELNGRVRRAFTEVRNYDKRSATDRAAVRDSFLEPPRPQRLSEKSSKEPGQISRGVSGLDYRIEERRIDDGCFFVPSLSRKLLQVDINTFHAFYDRVYRPLVRSEQFRELSYRDAMELLILAFSRAECSLKKPEDRAVASRIRELWGNVLTAFLG